MLKNAARIGVVWRLLPALALAAAWANPLIATASPPLEPEAAGVIIVADGAGGFETTSINLRQVVAEEGLPLQVEIYDWSHGFLRVLADQIDAKHVEGAAQCLAGRVLHLAARQPRPAIVLIGHSAGCAVMVAAGKYLPPATLEHIVLLAPAVSADFDLRPSLACVSRTVDVFYSTRDRYCLGIGTRLVGTTDRRFNCAPAGRIGFHQYLCSDADIALYTKLRQYPWDESQKWTGHTGGHYGCYGTEFLRAYVLPKLHLSEPTVSTH